MTTSVAAPSPKLFSRANLPLAFGAVALVTLTAFENRAVGTALPTLVQEFDAVGAFGVANAAPIAAFVVSLAITGLWADRAGPVPPLRAGVVGFGLGQLLVGTATGMPMIVAGRLLSGLAEGLVDVGLMVLIARTLPEVLRPRMFSLFAAAWVLPSVLGPLVTGLVTEFAGWRWVFLGALVLLVPTWLLIQPALRLVRPDGATGPDRPGRVRSVVPWAVTAAAAVFGLTLVGEHIEADPVPAVLVIMVCAAAAAVSARRLLPAGTFRWRRGLPSVVVMRGITGAAFAGAGSWLPLLLTLVHGYGPSRAGVSLSITGVTWAFGSWLQGREHRFTRVAVLRCGLTFIMAGLVLTSALAWTSWPVPVGLAGWAVAGVGMGLSSPTLSVLVLEHSDETNQGRNSSAAQLAGSLSIATTMAVSGTAIALAAPDPGRLVFGGILTACTVVAFVGVLGAGRVQAQAEEGDHESVAAR